MFNLKEVERWILIAIEMKGEKIRLMIDYGSPKM